MAIPSRVVAVAEDTATVECFGQTRDISLMLMAEEVAPGDYVTVMRNQFAVEKVPAEIAVEALAFFEKALDETAMEAR